MLKNKQIKTTMYIFTLLLSLIIIVNIVVFYVQNNNKFVKKSIINPIKINREKQIYKINEFIEDKNFALSLLSIEKFDQIDIDLFQIIGDKIIGDKAFIKGNNKLSGNYYVASLKIHNRTSDTVAFDKITVKLIDEQGKEYKPIPQQYQFEKFIQPRGSGRENLFMFKWKPTFQHDAYVIFEVPKNKTVTNGFITIQGSIFGEEEIKISF